MAVFVIALSTVSFAGVDLSNTPQVQKILAGVCDFNQPVGFKSLYGNYIFEWQMTDSVATVDMYGDSTYEYTDSARVPVDSAVVAVDTTFHCEDMLVDTTTLYKLALDTVGDWVPSTEYLELFAENFKDFDLSKLEQRAAAWQKQQIELQKAADERAKFVADSMAIEMEKSFFIGVDSLIKEVPNEIETLNEWMDPFDSAEKFAAALLKLGFDKRSAYVYANRIEPDLRQQVLFNAFTNAVQLKGYAAGVKRNFVEVNGPAMKKLLAADSTQQALIVQNGEFIACLDSTVTDLQENFDGYKSSTDQRIGAVERQVTEVQEQLSADQAWKRKMEGLAAKAKYNGSAKNQKLVDEALGK